MIPSEKELCARFNVERNTLRKALGLLVDEGRIIRKPGIGSLLSKAETVAGNLVLLLAQVDYLHAAGESFHYKLIHNLDQKLAEFGCNMLFKSVARVDDISETIRSANPKGIIFDSFNPEAFYIEAAASGVPCVSINQYTSLMTSIVSNNFDAAYQVTERLISAGHQRIAFILGKGSHETCRDRLRGVRALYHEQGLELKEEYLIPGDWLFSSGAEAAQRILSMAREKRPTAIFAFNDEMAYGCYNAHTRQGVSIPLDISIAGFDKNDRYAGMFPPISTVDVNLPAIVDCASWYLAERISGKAPSSLLRMEIQAGFCDLGTIRPL
jgi:LacI family transcriptional regulator